MTDVFDIANSKSVAKVDPGDEPEILGAPREDEAGLTRSEVRTVREGDVKKGWITVKGLSAYGQLCKRMEKVITGAATNVNKPPISLPRSSGKAVLQRMALHSQRREWNLGSSEMRSKRRSRASKP